MRFKLVIFERMSAGADQLDLWFRSCRKVQPNNSNFVLIRIIHADDAHGALT